MPGDDLRALFREVPSPVGVVTVAGRGRCCRAHGRLSRLAVRSTRRSSAIALGRHAALHELLREAGAFAISILASEQEHLAQHFARGVPPIAHWTGIETTAGELGAPLIDGALGWVECRIAFEREVGDHTLFVGEAVSVRRGPGREALVHLRRAYS